MNFLSSASMYLLRLLGIIPEKHELPFLPSSLAEITKHQTTSGSCQCSFLRRTSVEMVCSRILSKIPWWLARPKDLFSWSRGVRASERCTNSWRIWYLQISGLPARCGYISVPYGNVANSFIRSLGALALQPWLDAKYLPHTRVQYHAIISCKALRIIFHEKRNASNERTFITSLHRQPSFFLTTGLSQLNITETYVAYCDASRTFAQTFRKGNWDPLR